jgi:hypothetical protein
MRGTFCVTYEETIQTIPIDAEQARNYEALLALWEEQRARIEISTEELETWNERVFDLLRYDEQQLFRDETILASGIFGISEMNRLTKILLTRHGRIGQAKG